MVQLLAKELLDHPGPPTYFGSARNECMEKKMETTVMSYMGTTLRIPP